jgi:hypothetical protein
MPSAILGWFDLGLVWGTIKPDNHLTSMPFIRPAEVVCFPNQILRIAVMKSRPGMVALTCWFTTTSVPMLGRR